MKERNLYNLIKSRAEEIPQKSAIIYNYEEINYINFLNLIDRISLLITQKGIKGKGIAIALPRSPYLLATIIAVVHTSNYYIPLDLTYPNERIQYILNHSKSPLIISDKANRERFQELNVLCVDMDLEEHIIESVIENDSLSQGAYCIYTSGSTGFPKGVLVPESAIINFIDGMAKAINFNQSNAILCTTTQCFDIFFVESIMPIILGLTVVLSDQNEGKNPRKVLSLIEDFKIDVIQMTPSRIRMLMQYDVSLKAFQYVKILMIGGEPFPSNLLMDLKEKTNAKIYNMYGPTETTIWSSIVDLTEQDNITIGTPIINTRFYIMDESMHEVENGEIGELCISGDGLAIGYVNENSLTKARFVLIEDGTRVYKTGDLAKRDLILGNYIFVGRADNQIKLNGYRIELEEIEKVANRMDEILETIVVPIKKEDNEIIKLCLYYTSESELSETYIIGFLKKYLSPYMIPSNYVRVDKFKYTLNGKIDRKVLLQEIETINVEVLDSKEETGDVRTTIYKMVEKFTNEQINDNNKNTILGKVNSLEFVQLIVSLESIFDIEVEVEYLVADAFKDVDDLCDYIKLLVN